MRLTYEITSAPEVSSRPDRLGPDLQEFLRDLEIRIWPIGEPQSASISHLKDFHYRTFTLQRNGEHEELSLRDAWSSSSVELLPGDIVSLRFAIRGLAPGDWIIEATQPANEKWRQPEKHGISVAIRDGTETEDLRNLYLRNRRLIEPWPLYRQMTLELIAMDPLDYRPWRDLGGKAITHGDSREALYFLDKAQELLNAKLERNEWVPDAEIKGLEALLEFRQIHSIYERERLQSSRELGLRLRPVNGSFEWRWFDVKSGLSMNRFDPASPKPDVRGLEEAISRIGPDRIPRSRAQLHQEGADGLKEIAQPSQHEEGIQGSCRVSVILASVDRVGAKGLDALAGSRGRSDHARRYRGDAASPRESTSRARLQMARD